MNSARDYLLQYWSAIADYLQKLLFVQRRIVNWDLLRNLIPEGYYKSISIRLLNWRTCCMSLLKKRLRSFADDELIKEDLLMRPRI